MELFLDWTTGRVVLSRSELDTMFLERQFAPLPLRMEQYKASYTKGVLSNVLENVSMLYIHENMADPLYNSRAHLIAYSPLPLAGRYRKRAFVRSAHPQLAQAKGSSDLRVSYEGQGGQILTHPAP